MEEFHKQALNNNLPLLCKTIDPQTICPYLPCLSIPSKEQIEATQNCRGRYVAVQKLHEHLIRNPNAWSQLLSALRQPDLNLSHVADILDPPLQADSTQSPHHKEVKADVHQSGAVSDKRRNNTIHGPNKVWYGEDTTWNNLNAGVREILKELDVNDGAEKLAGALDFSVNDFNMIKTHKKDGCGSLALALIQDWNNREEATLGKLLAVLREIERIDVLRKLQEHTGFKLPDNHDEACENKTKDKVSVLRQQSSVNGGRESQKTSEQLTKSQSHRTDEMTGEQLSAQKLQKPDTRETIPRPNHPLDRSLSMVDTNPVLEPQAVRTMLPSIQRSQRNQRLEITERYAFPSQDKHASVPERPSLENKRIERVPNDANVEVLRVTCIGQESQDPGIFIPVTNNIRSESEEVRPWLNRVPQSVLPIPFVGQERWIGEPPKMAELQALWAQAYHSEDRDKWESTHSRYQETPATPWLQSTDNITSSQHISNCESHISEDTLNNNSSIDTPLSFPSINNMKSIRRVEMVDCVDTEIEGVDVRPVRQETVLTEHIVDQYRVIGDSKSDDSDSNNLSSLDYSAENNLHSSLENSTQVYSSEYSSIIKKANKYLPQLQSEDIITCDDVDQLDGVTSLSLDSFTSADDDSLTAGVTSEDSQSANTLTRGVTAATQPVNVLQTHIQTETNSMTYAHQTVAQTNEIVVGNINTWQDTAKTDNKNLSQSVGQGRDCEVSHDNCPDNVGSLMADNSQSFFSNALTTFCNETDSLPWKQLVGGAAALALVMKLKMKS